MKQLASGIGILFIGSSLFFGMSFLVTYVISDISHLFQIPYLIDFNLRQIFGAVIVFSIVSLKSKTRKKPEGEDSEDEMLARGIAEVLGNVLNVLMIWGLCYLAEYLFM